MRTAEEWLVEIENGLLYRKLFGYESTWPVLEGMYLNNPRTKTAVGPNLVFSMGDGLMSSLCVPSPEVTLQPDRMTGTAKVPVLEAVDNMLIRKTKLQSIVERSTLHNYLCGRAIVKVGYDSEWGWNPYYDVGPKSFPMGFSLTQFDKKGDRLEYRSSVLPGMPWVASVCPQDFVVPWGTIELDDAPWAAHRVIRANVKLKKDPKYKNTTALEPQMSMDAWMKSYSRVSTKRLTYRTQGAATSNLEPLYNELWEIHDKETNEIIVVTPDYDKFLRQDKDAIAAVCGGLPFESTSLVLHPRTFWSTPQAYYLMQIQRAQYDIALQAEKQRRINCLRFLAAKDQITQDELNKALSQDVGAIAFANTTRPLKEVVTTFPQGTNFDLGYEANVNYRYARDAVGFSSNQTGEFDPSTRRTKGEAMLVQMGSDKRTNRRMNCITSLYTGVLRKMNSIIFNWWARPRDIFVAGEWKKYTGEQLRDAYSYDISLSTKRHLSMAERKVEALMLTAQLIQLPGVNVKELYNYVVEASGDAAFERILGMAGKNKPKAPTGGKP